MNPPKRDKDLEQKIEEENQAKIDVLYSRVEEIKTASLELEEETKSSNSLAERVYEGVRQGADGIAGTIARFDEVVANKNNKVMIYLIGVCVIAFVLLWKGMTYQSST